MKLKHKLMLVFVTISLIAVIIVSFTGYNYIVNNSQNQVKVNLQSETEKEVASVNSWLISRAAVIQNLNSFIGNMPQPNKLTREYLKIYKSYGDISEMYIGFKDGSTITASGWMPPKGFDARKRPWYKAAINGNKLVFSDPYLDMITNTYTITVAMPLRDKNGKFIGIIGEDLLLSSIINTVKNLDLNGLGYGILIDKHGAALYDPNKKLTNTNISTTDETKKLISTMLYKKNGEIQYRLNNTNKLMLFRELTATGWILGIVMNTDVAYKTVDDLKNKYVIINILIFLLLLMVTLFFSRSITKPIYELIKGTEEFASGDLDKRLVVNSSDEIGSLARAFNKMAENLKNMMAEREKILVVLKASEETIEHERDELEVKVEERTQEFYALNQELSAMYEDIQKVNKELFLEVTERKNTEYRLDQKNKELEKAYTELKNVESQIIQQEKMASIGQLAAGVAHEINSPLGFITSNIETLQKYILKMFNYLEVLEKMIKELNSEVEESEIKIQRNLEIKEAKKKLKIDFIKEDSEEIFGATLDGAVRIKNIVQDLKTFARVSEDTNMAEINKGIESVINIVWNEIKYKITLNKDLGDIPMTRCNIGQLNQVFLNILVNAAQAIKEKGEINIKTREEEGYIVIKIGDSGNGIPPEVVNRIFEPFFTTKEVGSGTGLGLSISYGIIKKHNGKIEVESEIGKGTTFTIKIPVVLE